MGNNNTTKLPLYLLLVLLAIGAAAVHRHPAQDEGAPRPRRPPPGTRPAAPVLPSPPRGMDMTFRFKKGMHMTE